ncbi:MAG: TolC family protein [Proteobacteria bacterium]|nr:TolC family protein [Pseudomonadota bacterium]
MALEHLFSPLAIRGLTFRNRIFSTGHQTNMVEGGAPSARMAAYHEARAAGGAALIIMEAARMHETALSDGPVLDINGREAAAGYGRVAEAVKRHGAVLFGQLSHPGRVNARIRDGVRQPAWSASASRDARFGSIPRPLSVAQIEDIVAAYGSGAARMAGAGLDGVEITASHGMLPAQFLNPRVNRREDDYGGGLDGRLRFLREVLEAVRAALGPGPILGLRLSIDEMQIDGLTPDEVIEACRVLDAMAGLDYFNVAAGSMAGLGGSVHVVPPMAIEAGYLAPPAERLRRAVANRPEIRSAEYDVNTAELELKRARNDLLPQLDLTASYRQGGRDLEIRDTFRGVRDHQDQTYSWGLTASVPLGNRTARGSHQRAVLSVRQAEQRLEQAKQEVMLAVRIAARAAITSEILVESNRQARILQEANVAAEERRLRLGVTTSYRVLQILEDLTAAQTQEVQATINFEKAITDVQVAEGTLLANLGIEYEVPEPPAARTFMGSMNFFRRSSE